VPKDKHAIALADYYTARPSLFGNQGALRTGAIFRPDTLAVNRALARTISAQPGTRASAPSVFSGQPPRPGDPSTFIPDQTSFLNFEVAMISLIAKAWESADFRELIKRPQNVPSALQTVRGYDPKWTMRISIVDDASAKWESGAQPATNGSRRAKPAKQTSRWTNLTPHMLRLNFPNAPREARDHSIALASYNSTGAQYPFTCCCETPS